MKQMYPGKINSPATSLVANITAIQTSFTVTDGSKLPDAPNLLTIGRGDTAETILYTSKVGNDISGITRGFQGTAAAWNIGTPVARYITAYDMDTLKENIEDLNTPARSPNQTTQTPVTSYPTATEDGLVNGTIGGQSLVNGMTDGDFDATTGHTATGGTLTVSGKVATLTGNGTSATVSDEKNTTIPCAAGKKVYCRLNTKVTNAVAASINLKVAGSTGGTPILVKTQATPVNGQYYLMSGIATLDAGQTGVVKGYFDNVYADAATANAKVMNANTWMFHDLDAHGLTSKTVAELDAMSDAYFEGLASVVNPVVTSEGKNWFNKKAITDAKYIDSNGGLQTSVTENVSDYIPVELLSTSFLSGQTFSHSAGIYGAWYDSSKVRISVFSMSGVNNETFTAPSGARYVRLTINDADLDTTQFEKGTVETAYEPYQVNTLSIPATLRSLPNGGRDTYDVATGKLTQNVSAEYTLLSGDITALVTSYTNVDTVELIDPSDSYDSTTSTGSQTQALISGYVGMGFSDSVARYWTWFKSSSDQKFKLVVPKGLYANLAAAQAALAGTKILYQLATPVETVLTDDKLVCFKGGRFYTNAAIVPQAVINTPINLAEKAESSFNLAQKAESKLSVISMPITMVAPETTITDIAAALTEINTAFRTKYDLSKCSQARLALAVKTVGSASAEVRIQYSLDESTWNYLDGVTGPAVNISALGAKVSAWGPIASLAKADVFLRAVTINGDGAADPVIGNVTLQVR